MDLGPLELWGPGVWRRSPKKQLNLVFAWPQNHRATEPQNPVKRKRVIVSSATAGHSAATVIQYQQTLSYATRSAVTADLADPRGPHRLRIIR